MPLENFRSHRRSVVLRTSKSFKNCFDLLRSAQYLSPKWFGFFGQLTPVNEQFSVNDEVNRHLQQPSRWEIAQRQRLVSLIGLSRNYNIAD